MMYLMDLPNLSSLNFEIHSGETVTLYSYQSQTLDRTARVRKRGMEREKSAASQLGSY
jgi:hypothetical protein